MKRDQYGIMLRLRLCEGVDLHRLEAQYGCSLQALRSGLTPYEQAGYLTFSDDRLALTPAGFAVSNSLIAELLMLAQSDDAN